MISSPGHSCAHTHHTWGWTLVTLSGLFPLWAQGRFGILPALGQPLPLCWGWPLKWDLFTWLDVICKLEDFRPQNKVERYHISDLWQISPRDLWNSLSDISGHETGAQSHPLTLSNIRKWSMWLSPSPGRSSNSYFWNSGRRTTQNRHPDKRCTFAVMEERFPGHTSLVSTSISECQQKRSLTITALRVKR